MKLSAREAAEQVGMTKQGIIRAIHKGTLSATRNINKEFEIDPAELQRVYAPKTTTVNFPVSVDDNLIQSQMDALRDKVLLLERIIDEKDKRIADLTTTIEAERKVTLLLTDKQQPNFWRKLFDR